MPSSFKKIGNTNPGILGRQSDNCSRLRPPFYSFVFKWTDLQFQMGSKPPVTAQVHRPIVGHLVFLLKLWGITHLTVMCFMGNMILSVLSTPCGRILFHLNSLLHNTLSPPGFTSEMMLVRKSVHINPKKESSPFPLDSQGF